MSSVPPGRHPNWCNCQGCRRNIAEFEARQFRGVMIVVAVLAFIGLIIAAAHAIA